MRVVVVGSGIAGLSCTIALRRTGLDVALYERAPELREVGAGISLWANALRAFDYLGAGDAVRAASERMTRSELRLKNGYRVATSLDLASYERRRGLPQSVAMTHRAELVGVLASFLPVGVTRYGHECTGVEEAGDRVLIRFQNGATDSAHVVIGADGIHSAVRGFLFGRSEPRYAGYTCWRGIAPRPDGLEPGYVGEWWGRGRRFGIVTLLRDRVYWFAVATVPPGERSPDEKAAVAGYFRGWASPVESLIVSTPPGQVLRNDIFDRVPGRPWHRGRCVLVGDAAHPTTPNLGQGGCLAVEDAVVLARQLAGPGEVSDRLAAFEAERYGRATWITKTSRRLGRLAQWENRIACIVRDVGLRFLMPLSGPAALLKPSQFDVGPLPGK